MGLKFFCRIRDQNYIAITFGIRDQNFGYKNGIICKKYIARYYPDKTDKLQFSIRVSRKVL